MTPYELIDKKKRGGEHGLAEIQILVDGVLSGSIPEYQLSAWLMAVWHQGMTDEETFLLTDRMRASGVTLDTSGLPRPSADKHSTGGVGDKVSLLLAPLAAELGLCVPMLSGRGLGHTGGTLDKLQAIPGYRIDLSGEEFLTQVASIGCAITGQTGEMAPADRVLYHLRDVTATVDCVPLIVSSILSKKLAAGPRHLVIDLKCGSGAFMTDLDAARELGRALLATGTRAGLRMSVLITDMGQPLGRAVGHALEVRESLAGLSGGGPADLSDLTVELVAEMAALAGLGERSSLLAEARSCLQDGRALRRFLSMVQAQGGRLDPHDPAASLSVAPAVEPLKASSSGWIAAMDAAEIGLAVVDLGGGRVSQEDELDLSVGLNVECAVGDRVEPGQPLVSIHAHDEARAGRCRERLARSIVVASEETVATPLVLDRLTSS